MPEPSVERLVKDAHRVLENPFWIPGLAANESYSRLHDDHDGEFVGNLMVSFGPDGDAWLATDIGPGKSLRFRTGIGGGMSLRVRNALMLLALAIKLDNEDRPQQIPKGVPSTR